MDFNLTEDRRILQETLIRFLRDRYGWDHRASVAYTAPFHDPGAWAQLAEMGVMGMLFAKARRGMAAAASISRPYLNRWAGRCRPSRSSALPWLARRWPMMIRCARV